MKGVWEGVMQVGKREALWVVRLMEMAEEGRAGCGVEMLKVVMAKVARVAKKLVGTAAEAKGVVEAVKMMGTCKGHKFVEVCCLQALVCNVNRRVMHESYAQNA